MHCALLRFEVEQVPFLLDQTLIIVLEPISMGPGSHKVGDQHALAIAI